jgi:hypothetical protein
MEDLVIDGSISKWIFEKKGVKVKSGLTWLRMRSNVEVL